MAGDWPSQQRELSGILTRFPIESVKDTTNRLQKYGFFPLPRNDMMNYYFSYEFSPNTEKNGLQRLYRKQHQQLRGEDAQKHGEWIHRGITHVGQFATLGSYGVGESQSGRVGV